MSEQEKRYQAERQRVFDTVARHLLKQGRKSQDDYHGCMYRTSSEAGDVLKCAIGCLIADEHYDAVFEQTTTEEENVVSAVRKSGFLIELAEDPDKDAGCFLVDLQSIHDNMVVSEWASGLARVAWRYGLDADALRGWTSYPPRTGEL